MMPSLFPHRHRVIAAIGLSALICAEAGAVRPADSVDAMKASAQAVVEVKVLGVRDPRGADGDLDIVYEMEVLSVLRATVAVEPGETIHVRSAQGRAVQHGEGVGGTETPPRLDRGWIGTAYLNRAPGASGPNSARQFEEAAAGDSLVEMPPGPPSLQYTVPLPGAR